MKKLLLLFSLLTILSGLVNAQDHYYSIEEALKNPSKVQYLDLRDQGLTELPDEMKQFTNMIRCELADNELTELPDWIDSWEHLVYLGASNNKLEKIPSSIGNIKYLESVDFIGNQLVSIPKSMTNNWKLKHLYLRDNQLSGGSVIKALKKLSGIRKIDLRGNPINDKMQIKLRSAFPDVKDLLM